MIDGIPGIEKKHRCDCCERECERPCTYPALQKGEAAKVFMCQTCWAIWYDGVTEINKIKEYSIQWPVDHIGAYATDNKESIANSISISERLK